MDEVEEMLAAFGLGFRELPREALFRASQAFRAYRERGGTKTAPLPDRRHRDRVPVRVVGGQPKVVGDEVRPIHGRGVENKVLLSRGRQVPTGQPLGCGTN